MRVLFAFPAPKGDRGSYYYHGDFVSAASLGEALKKISTVTTIGPKGMADIEYEVPIGSKRHIYQTFQHIAKIQHEYDLVHYHIGGWNAINYFKMIKKPLVLTIHDPPTSGLEFSFYSKNEFIRCLESQRINIVYPSDYAATAFLNRLDYPFAGKLTSSILHGIDIPPNELPNLDRSSRPNEFISVGRMEVLKNFHLLATFLQNKLTVVAGPNIHGKHKADMWTNYFKETGTLHLYPMQKNELYRLYETHKCYVSFSRVETFGFTAVEAALVGTLPIVTNEGGLGEIVRMLGIPTLVTPFAKKKLLKDELFSLATQLNNMRYDQVYDIVQTVKNKFNVMREAQEYLDLYKKVLHGN